MSKYTSWIFNFYYYAYICYYLMLSILKQPYPLSSNKKRIMLLDVFAGALIFAVLYLFRPFGIALIQKHSILLVTLGFGLATTLVALFYHVLLPKLAPKFFIEERWTVGKEIILLLVVILSVCGANLAIASGWLGNSFNLRLVFRMLQYTILLSAIPVASLTIIKQQYLLHKYKTQAADITSSVTEPLQHLHAQTNKDEPSLPESLQLTITGNYQNETLQLFVNDFLFAEAADNYTQIHYLAQGMPQSVLFRTTIKGLEQQLATANQVYKCHRSFLINLNHVVQISGNAQGYKLQQKQHNTLVPVSRTLNAEIKEMLQKYSHLAT